MPIRFAILGAGRIGQVHARAVSGNDDAVLAAISDPVEAAAKSVADRYGADIRDVDAIVAADDIDAVVLCTPTDLHAQQIELFARAGKAVFCEKPIDLDSARVRSCLSVVEETGATLMVGFNRRLVGQYVKNLEQQSGWTSSTTAHFVPLLRDCFLKLPSSLRFLKTVHWPLCSMVCA